MSDLMIVPFKLTGIRPLLVHNGRLADSLDPYTKALAAVASKRKKTEEDYEAMAWREFLGSLYWGNVAEGDDTDGPYIPSTYVETAVSKAASLLKKRGRDVSRGVTIEPLQLAIQYDGPRDVQDLYDDRRFVNRSRVKVGQQAVMRTRPMFREWVVEGEARVQADVLDASDFVQFLNGAGTLIGLGDWRPKYGQFTVETESPFPATV